MTIDEGAFEQMQELSERLKVSEATSYEVRVAMNHLIAASREQTEALRELCETKILKEVQGNTAEYRARRDAAWKKAFACFPQYARQAP